MAASVIEINTGRSTVCIQTPSYRVNHSVRGPLMDVLVLVLLVRKHNHY